MIHSSVMSREQAQAGSLPKAPVEVTSISHDPDHYEKSFRVYLKVSNRIYEISAFLEERLSESIVGKLKPIDSGKTSFTLKTLGVGCGSGKVDWTIMNQLSKQFPKISHTVLEPYETIHEHRALVGKQPIPSITSWDWRRQTWEEFAEESRQRQPLAKFHFISAVSVLYYLESWKDSLLNMYEHLEDGGLLLITVVTEDAGYLQAGKKFPALFDEGVSTMTSKIIKDFLSSRDIQFTYLRHHHYADISCCFEENSEAGSLLLDFLSHVKDFEKSNPKKLVRDFRTYLKTPECSRQVNGAIMLNISTDTIVVEKGVKKELNI